MYTKIKPSKTTLKVNDSVEGETIEDKMKRIMNNKEPITDGAPIIFTERKDGVKPEYNIKTDRFELAVDATDHMTKQALAQRENRLKAIKGDGDAGSNSDGTGNVPNTGNQGVTE